MKNNHSSHSNKIASLLQLNVGIECALLSLFVLSALAGCGQRGSLYLPATPEAAQRSSIVETLSAPATSDAEKKGASSTRSPMTSPASKQ